MLTTLSQIAAENAPAGDAAQFSAAPVPIAVTIALASLTLGGILVWLVGSRLLRPAFVFVGTVAGATLGFAGTQALTLGIDPLWVSGFGLVTGGVLGWIMYRIAVSISFAVLLGAAVAMATLSAFQFRPDSSSKPELVGPPIVGDLGALSEFAPDLPEIPESLLIARDALALQDEATADIEEPSQPRSGLRAALDMGFARGSEFAKALASRLQPLWDGLTVRDRLFLGGSYVLGFLIGLALGVGAPTRAAGAITAFAGPAIWIPSGVLLIETARPASTGWMPDDPMPWLALWGLTVVIGLVIQWIRPKRHADKG